MKKVLALLMVAALLCCGMTVIASAAKVKCNCPPECEECASGCPSNVLGLDCTCAMNPTPEPVERGTDFAKWLDKTLLAFADSVVKALGLADGEFDELFQRYVDSFVTFIDNLLSGNLFGNANAEA